MPLLGPTDPLLTRPQRVLVGGASGSGKSTLARSVSDRCELPYVELDALFHGPQWTERTEFIADVVDLAQSDHWVTEWQYQQAKPILVGRGDLFVMLDLPRSVVFRRVVGRTLWRRVKRTELWNGNREPPLRTIFTDRDHVVRYSMRTWSQRRDQALELVAQLPDLTVVWLRSPTEVVEWVQRLG